MLLADAFSKFRNAFSGGRRQRHARKANRRTFAAAEVLEERVLMTGFYVAFPDEHTAAYGDFNGDGDLDLVEGDSQATVTFRLLRPVNKAGEVNVTYDVGGNPSNQTLHRLTPGVAGRAQVGDYFGAALAVGDFNGDQYDDLAVGVPGQDLDDKSSVGAIQIFYGSATGLSTANDHVIHQDSTGVEDTAEKYDGFGYSLAVGNFNNDAYDDLAVGVPTEGVGGDHKAGLVNLFYGTSSGIQGADSLTQDSKSVAGGSEANDFFGYGLTSNDFNGDGYDDLAIGVPLESIDHGIFHFEDVHAGAVNIVYGSPNGLTVIGNDILYQGKRAVQGGTEDEDQFGHALSGGDFNGDGFEDLIVGVPGEDVGSLPDVGLVHVLYGAAAKGSLGDSDRTLNYFSLGLSEFKSEVDNHGFGAATAVGDFNKDGFDDVAVRTTVGIGEVIVVYGSAAGLQPRVENGAPLSAQRLRSPLSLPVNKEYIGQPLVGDINGDGYADIRIPTRIVIDDFVIRDHVVHYGTRLGLRNKNPSLVQTPLPNQNAPKSRISHSESSVQLLLAATDAFGEQLNYQVQLLDADPLMRLAYGLDSKLNLRFTGNYSEDWGGAGEKWMASDNGWHFVLPDGGLYRWRGAAAGADFVSNSEFIAQFNSTFHSNPAQLHDAVTPQDGTKASLIGNRLTIEPAEGYIGELRFKLTTSNSNHSTSESLVVSITDSAPELAVADREMSYTQDVLTVALPATDADGETVSYTVQVESDADATFASQIDQRLNLRFNRSYSENWGGAGEKWMKGDAGWFFITPAGRLYHWTGAAAGTDFLANSDLLATLNSTFSADPALLHDAPAPLTSTAVVNGNQLVVDPADGFLGDLKVTLTATDGHLSTTDVFIVSVTNASPVLSIANKTMSQRFDTLTISLKATDPDGDAVTYSVQLDVDPLTKQASDLKKQLGLRFAGSYAENWGGANERWMRGDGGWYFITSDGNLYKWNGTAAGSEFLNESTLVANLDGTFYEDPSKLHDGVSLAGSTASMTDANRLVIDPAAAFRGILQITVAANDGNSTTTQTFQVTVTD